jgi:lysosomal alpha-glucosidase
LSQCLKAILNFNIFGTPLMGADICGFTESTTLELCARWSALGAFYPFSRNHNSLGAIDQDPAALGPIVVAAANNSLTIRYQLLPYLYTLFYRANQFGDTVFRPLFFEFVLDKNCYSIETQFMWGSALMIIPTLEEGVNQVKGYLPLGIWYDFNKSTPITSRGQYFVYNSSLTDPPVVLIRGGHIIPCQQPMPTTTLSRNSNFSLIVALNESKQALGELYWDDGDSIADKLIQYNLLKFVAQNVRFKL